MYKYKNRGMLSVFTPAEVAKNVIGIGKAKTSMTSGKLFFLGILAGMFIAFAAVGSTTVTAFMQSAGAARIIGACVFPAGLSMVLVAGSELFTGNCLIAVSVLSGESRFSQMIRNWICVYIGNFVGAMIVALMMSGSGLFSLSSGAAAAAAVSTAASKCSLSFVSALLRGIMCNFLVCIAVWMSFAAKTVSGKIIGAFFPVMLFVLCGFEHSVANMYYIPAGLFASNSAAFASVGGAVPECLTWGAFFVKNLIPVTLGNIIGGCVFVGAVYWGVYLREGKK